MEKQKHVIEQQKHQIVQSLPPHLPPPGKDPRLLKYSNTLLSDEPLSPTSLFPVSMQPPPLNNVPQTPEDQKGRLIPPQTSHSHPPPLMHNFDPRQHNRGPPPNDIRSEPPLSERLAHIMQTQVNHDPRLQPGSQYRNQNKDQDRFHQNIVPNTQEPPPAPTFKPEPPPMRPDIGGTGAAFNHHNNTNNFQDIKPTEVPNSQLPFNQPPPPVFQGPPSAPPSNPPPLAFPPRKSGDYFIIFRKSNQDGNNSE